MKGKVALVKTRGFWRADTVSPTKQCYHRNSNAETYHLIGDALRDELDPRLRGSR